MKHDNPWHGLLFLHGHIADQALARSLAQDESQPAAAAARPARTLLSSLSLLGGRPMHAGFNFDLEEPLSEGTTPVRGRTPTNVQGAACATC